MSSEGFSLSFLRREIDQLRRDRTAYVQAYDILRKRIIESNEEDIPRRPLLHEWSGTRAVIGSLEMAIHAIERTITEMDTLIRGILNGEIPNSDPPDHPGLGVVDGGKTK